MIKVDFSNAVILDGKGTAKKISFNELMDYNLDMAFYGFTLIIRATKL